MESNITNRKRILSSVATAIFFGVGIPCVTNAEIDIRELSIPEIERAFYNRTYTSEQLTGLFLARIEKFNPYYNAFTAMNSKALDEARDIDRRRKAGEQLGPLAGIPVVVKDTMDMAGLPSTAGYAPLSSRAGGFDLIPEKDSAVVQRLRAAGAIILAKTNVPVFSGNPANANDSWAGVTYNALNRSWSPGGSSAGTGTAVAANFAVVGLAEETGGSIQNPAGAQSLVGIKPTFGLVPNSGVIPQAGSTRDVVGPIARTVRDAAMTLDVLAGYTLEDPKTTAAFGNIPQGGYTSGLQVGALKGKRIGLLGPGWSVTLGKLPPQTKAQYRKAIAQIEALGAIAVVDPFAGSGFVSLAPADGSYDPRGSDAHAYDLDLYLKNLGESAVVHSLDELQVKIGVNLFEKGGPLDYYAEQLPILQQSYKKPGIAPDLSDFTQLRENYLRVFNQVMDENNLDALVFPQMVEPVGDVYESFIESTSSSPINIAGVPGVVVPSGAYPGGQPFSLIFIGRLWSEGQLQAYAFDYEHAVKGRLVPASLATTPGPKSEQFN
ncbi:amidase [Pseudomonas frederiksbergensis]|uniref:Amidase n=1 Tax=Pseudomonas frederiksbergensis TaxID=104087 RepID=A0A423KLH2_9PSED|nr:amidase [Pseudomonas frederiksbergensis]RON54737.1 amidase [Pseudomonas frederiksbergensis]